MGKSSREVIRSRSRRMARLQSYEVVGLLSREEKRCDEECDAPRCVATGSDWKRLEMVRRDWEYGRVAVKGATRMTKVV